MVAVSVDNQVNTGCGFGDHDTGEVAILTQVAQGYDKIGLVCQQCNHFDGRLGRVGEGEAFNVIGVGFEQSLRRGQAKNGHAHTFKLPDDVFGQQRGGVSLQHVGGQNGEIGKLGKFQQAFVAVVKVMVTRRHGIIAGGTHGLNDGGSKREIADGLPMHGVTGVKEQDILAEVFLGLNKG